MIKTSDIEINEVEKILLPTDCHFSEEGKNIIRCNDSKEILACPGSGKTTLLMAKLYLLSKYMPFERNRGICVLSHTNVAIDEIKSKLGDSSSKILSYPNYVGTIQSFIDKYVVFPYLTHFTDGKIEVVDNKKYAECVWRICEKQSKFAEFKFFVNNQVNTSNKFSEPIEYIESLYLNDEKALCSNSIKRIQAGSNKKATLQYCMLKSTLIKIGIVKYEDTYFFAQQALNKYGEQLKKILSSRFRYVFVDEYQDCDFLQCCAINKLFDIKDTVVQKIGDVDQAIYTGTKSEETTWEVSENALFLPGSNRYNQQIANVLVKLRTNNEKIISLTNQCAIKPTLIVFDKSKITSVISAYVEEISSKHLQELYPNGKYKAVGMIKNGKGLTINDYWDGYKNDNSSSNKWTMNDYVQIVKQYLNIGNLCEAERNIRKMLCQVCFIINCKDNSDKYYTINSIKKGLYEYEKIDYKEEIIALTKLTAYNSQKIKNQLINLIEKVLAIENMKLLDAFINSTESANLNVERLNTWKDDNQIEIEFDTVYKVKGETHTATLYLETETSRSSDLKRIMPLLQGKNVKNKTEIHEKSRKVAYVGLSRPTHLLCVAMQKETFLGNEETFKNWKVIKLEQ